MFLLVNKIRKQWVQPEKMDKRNTKAIIIEYLLLLLLIFCGCKQWAKFRFAKSGFLLWKWTHAIQTSVNSHWMTSTERIITNVCLHEATFLQAFILFVLHRHLVKSKAKANSLRQNEHLWKSTYTNDWTQPNAFIHSAQNQKSNISNNHQNISHFRLQNRIFANIFHKIYTHTHIMWQAFEWTFYSYACKILLEVVIKS